MVVDGEPGIGKTSLVRRALVDATAQAITASGDEAEQSLEWGLVDQIERSLATVRPPGRPDAAGVGTALAGALAEAAVDRPLVLVVDDAQWADAASLRALAFAMRRLDASPVVLCVTCRTSGLDAVPPGLLARAAADDARLRLGPLDRVAVAELAERTYGRPLSSGASERLHAHTEGNPLHTVALLGELDVSVVAGRDSLPAPRSYATLVSAQLAGCSPAARRLAGALAVLSHGSRESVAVAAAGLDDASGAVAELVAAGLVVRECGGHRQAADATLAFAHALVHASIHDDLPPSELADLHRGAALATAGDEQLRHRLAAAHGPDADLVVTATDRADALAATGAPGAAARLRVAAAAAAAPVVRDELLLGAAVELMQAGEPLGRLGDEVRRLGDGARRSLILGREALLGGQRDEARAWLGRAWEQASGDRVWSPLLPSIADMLSLTALDAGDWDELGRWAERAVDRGSTSGLSATLLAHALVLTRRAPEAERRMSLLVDDDDVHPLRALDARVGRGVARLWSNDLEGAAEDLGVAAGRLGGDGSLLAQAEIDAHRAEVALRAGDWPAALALAEAAAAVVDDADAVWLGALAHGVVAFVLAARGDVPAADRHAAMAAGSARDTGLMAAGLWAHHAAMRVAVAAGDHAAVARLGDRMAHEAWGDVPEGVHHWRAAYAESLVALERVDDATRVAAELEAEARSVDDVSVAADAARARGVTASADRRDDAAAAAFARGLALDETRSRPFERARLELAAGAHLRRTGQRRAAADLLGTAAQRLASLGAAPWVDRCRHELEACGLRPRRRDGRPPELTARERLVAGVVARGRSNREVAAELGISVKTVEHHLGRIYAKVGVRSRAQLVVHLADGAGGTELITVGDGPGPPR